MDCIKFRLIDSESHKIETDLFEAETRKSYPFYQKQASGHISQFAICPECDNPVQIIGLYKKSTHTDKKFAKHCAEPIPHMGIYDKDNYEYCPYRAKRKYFTKDSRKVSINHLAKNIIIKLVSHFDKVIYFLQKEIGIFITPALAEQMLNDFFTARAYLYPGASLRNTPLILAYFTLNKGLIGRAIHSSELKECLNALAGLHVNIKNNKLENISEPRQYNNIGFHFSEHRTCLEEHHLSESLMFIVSKGEVGHVEVVYRKRINFDNSYLENLFNFNPSQLSDVAVEKNTKLLILARTVAAHYGFNID